jgi:hypothetical protein
MVSFKPQPLYLERKSSSGHGSDKKNSQTPPGIETWNPNHPAHSIVTIPLSWLFEFTHVVFYSTLHGQVLIVPTSRTSKKNGYFSQMFETENSTFHHVWKGSEAHVVSYPMGTRGSFPGGKVARGMKLTRDNFTYTFSTLK